MAPRASNVYNVTAYRPRLSPEQEQLFELSKYLGRDLTQEEFMQITGKGKQQAGASQKSPASGLDDIFKSGEAKGAAAASVGAGGAASVGAGGGTVFANGATVAGQAVGTAANGGTLMSTGVIVPASEGIPVASTAGTAGTAGLEGAGAASGAFDLAGIGSAGNFILPAAGAIGIGDILLNNRGKTRGGLQGAASGAAIGSYFSPWGAVIGGGVGGLTGLAKGFMEHETTRDRAKRHTGELSQVAPNDTTYQNYLKGMRAQFESAPPDPSKPFAGKYGSWDEYKKAGLQADDLTGVYGNLKAFGPDWAKLNFDQQKAVTQKIIDANLYNSRKGEVEITDEAAAKRLFDEASKSGFKIPVASKTPIPLINKPLVLPASAGAPVGSTPPAFMIPRSKTVSPGIPIRSK